MYVLLAVIDLPTVLHWQYTSTRWEKVINVSRSAFSSVDLLSWLQFDQQYNEFKLRSIMSEHKRTITAISWCPGNPDLFASASADNLLIIWNVAEQRTVARLDNTKGQRRICSPSPWRADIYHRPLLSQVSPHQSAGAGTQLMGWHLCPSVARYTSGSTVILTPGSPSTRRPTRSSQTSASSGGTPTKKASWCLDTRMAVCPFFNQVCMFSQFMSS